mmetsp:Transcript_33988/g.78514  ORF Transcript_33988/g.78514 Transcript_33988/m.78514 type:complete len:103 (-) Transcript_33988:713-1021(-)
MASSISYTISSVSSSCSSSCCARRHVAATWLSLTQCLAELRVRSHGSSMPESTVTNEILRRHACASGWQSSLAKARALKIFLPSSLNAVSVAIESVRRYTSS